MIISKTPMRISFTGGGTDLPSFYEKAGYGEVLSSAIDKYMYVSLNKRFDSDIRISYSKLEIIKSIEKIKHDLVKGGFKMLRITKPEDTGWEITSTADVHSRGTGLGSSSAFAVGWLNVLHKFRRDREISKEQLADEACKLEIDICHKPIGKQDQYASAFGGLNRIRFDEDGVDVKPVDISTRKMWELNASLMMFYTAIDRKNGDYILEQQSKIKAGRKFNILMQMRDLVSDSAKSLKRNDFDRFGEILDENWQLKRQLVSGISNKVIDKYYSTAKKAGAIGGKLCGQGGCGFLLLYVPWEQQFKVREALGLREMQMSFDTEGTKIIYSG